MLHMVVTLVFLGAGMFSLSLIAAMLVDEAPAIAHALGLRRSTAPLPVPARRVRIIRNPRLTPMSPAQQRAAA